jgi:hypothetical protein
MFPCSTIPCADDATITNNIPLFSSGAQALYLNGGTTGGPSDIILPFGTSAPYTSGNFELKTDIYVNSSAYLNIQAETVVGQGIGVWALDIQMDNLGNITIDNGGGAVVFLNSTFPLQEWFEFKLIIDLTLNIWEVYINNQSIGSFSNTTNKISSINFYPTIGNEYYIDNICYTYTPFIPLMFDMSAINLNTQTNLAISTAPFIISGDIVNFSSTTINNVDINYSINGTTPNVDNLNGLNLFLFDTLNFNHTISWNPISTGTYIIEIWASNLNGNIDLNINNDTLKDTIYIWEDIALRKPLIETFTSSTCVPCAPANVTSEALFAQNLGKFTSIKYQADFPGTGDPYFTQEGGNRRNYYNISSVPRMEIDGGWDQNGNNINQQVLDEYISFLTFLNISATYTINIKTIDVSIILEPLENYSSNNLVIHAAIIEEITYNNIKNNGETEFEHVVKKMLPSDNGTQIGGLIGGQQTTQNLNYTFNGNYRLPNNALTPINHQIEHSVEDFSKLKVVVWVQDVVTKEIHQSTYATLSSVVLESYNCINNSCVDPQDGTGTYANISDCQSNCVNTIIKEETEGLFVFPNPAYENIYFSKLSDVKKIKIFDVSGRIVLEKKNINTQKINISFLSKGIYQIKIEGKNWKTTRKFIKN